MPEHKKWKVEIPLEIPAVFVYAETAEDAQRIVESYVTAKLVIQVPGVTEHPEGLVDKTTSLKHGLPVKIERP